MFTLDSRWSFSWPCADHPEIERPGPRCACSGEPPSSSVRPLTTINRRISARPRVGAHLLSAVCQHTPVRTRQAPSGFLPPPTAGQKERSVCEEHGRMRDHAFLPPLSSPTHHDGGGGGSPGGREALIAQGWEPTHRPDSSGRASEPPDAAQRRYAGSPLSQMTAKLLNILRERAC